MRLDIGSHGLLLVSGERWRRQAVKYFVEDEDFDLGLGLFFFPEPVDLRQERLDRMKQLPARLLELFPFVPYRT